MSDGHAHESATATTWHHGLIARWWANFKLDGPEIAFFGSYVASGQPALDVGCGNGRLLVPWVADGLDVDGVDASLPCGVLALDYEVYEFDDDRWRRWKPRPIDETPPPSQDRRLAPDGFHYAQRHRIAAVDVAERSMTREMQTWQWQHDELVAHETHTLISNLYSSNEIVTLLDSVGFTDVHVLGGYHDGAPTEDDEFHVFIATDTQ